MASACQNACLQETRLLRLAPYPSPSAVSPSRTRHGEHIIITSCRDEAKDPRSRENKDKHTLAVVVCPLSIHRLPSINITAARHLDCARVPASSLLPLGGIQVLDSRIDFEGAAVTCRDGSYHEHPWPRTQASPPLPSSPLSSSIYSSSPSSSSRVQRAPPLGLLEARSVRPTASPAQLRPPPLAQAPDTHWRPFSWQLWEARLCSFAGRSRLSRLLPARPLA